MRNKIKTILYFFVLTLVSFVFFNITRATNKIDRNTQGTIYHDATSTNYEIKGGAGDPAVGRSYSANYIIDNGLTMDLSEMTLTFSTSSDLGVTAPGIAFFTITTATVNMVGTLQGFNLQVKRDDAVSTLNLNGAGAPNTTFPDETAWNPAGAGNATTTPGDNLSMRVYKIGTNSNYDSVWWGADDSAGTAKYTGFSSVSQQVMNCTNCLFGSFNTVLEYRASPPFFQPNGAYSGTITLTALVNL
ncbi:hypothetical protein KJ839_06750 [Patescibacteria group bacterium]|nr:hypothetical protein [Patescibacteria group bacterium]MBU1674112.1 hypothetical protein [Patescibacteria group bacterium]